MVVLTLPVFILVYRIPYFKINGNKKDTGFQILAAPSSRRVSVSEMSLIPGTSWKSTIGSCLETVSTEKTNDLTRKRKKTDGQEQRTGLFFYSTYFVNLGATGK
jgi:hypothetical protein